MHHRHGDLAVAHLGEGFVRQAGDALSDGGFPLAKVESRQGWRCFDRRPRSGEQIEGVVHFAPVQPAVAVVVLEGGAHRSEVTLGLDLSGFEHTLLCVRVGGSWEDVRIFKKAGPHHTIR